MKEIQTWCLLHATYLCLRDNIFHILTILSFLLFDRYSYEQQLNSLIVAACRNMTSSLTADSTSRDGAFYRAVDQAGRDEDWGNSSHISPNIHIHKVRLGIPN